VISSTIFGNCDLVTINRVVRAQWCAQERVRDSIRVLKTLSENSLTNRILEDSEEKRVRDSFRNQRLIYIYDRDLYMYTYLYRVSVPVYGSEQALSTVVSTSSDYTYVPETRIYIYMYIESLFPCTAQKRHCFFFSYLGVYTYICYTYICIY